MRRDEIIARLESTEVLSRERANLEFALWEIMTPEQKADALKSYDGLRFAEKGYRIGGMAFHLKVVLKVPYSDLVQRSILRAAGDDAAALWEHIDAGLIVTNTAYKLLRDARKMSVNTNPARPVKEVLSELLTSPLPKIRPPAAPPTVPPVMELNRKTILGVTLQNFDHLTDGGVAYNKILAQLRSAKSLPSRERANLELALWECATPKQREVAFKSADAAEAAAKGYSPGGFAFYIKTVLHESYEDVSTRSILRRAKGNVSALWEEIDSNKIVTSVAYRIFRQARKICGETSQPIDAVLSELLTEYHALPIRVGKDGRTHHIRSQYSLQKSKRTPEGTNPRSTKNANGHSTKNTNGHSTKNGKEESSRTFWFKIRSAMADLAALQLKGVEPHIAEKLIKELEGDVAILIENFGVQVRKYKNQGSLSEIRKAISRKRVLDACNTLGMNPPKPDKLVDEVLAKKRWKISARTFHPDANGGKEHLRPQYQAVMEAYKLLLEYNEQLTGKTGEPANELRDD